MRFDHAKVYDNNKFKLDHRDRLGTGSVTQRTVHFMKEPFARHLHSWVLVRQRRALCYQERSREQHMTHAGRRRAPDPPPSLSVYQHSQLYRPELIRFRLFANFYLLLIVLSNKGGKSDGCACGWCLSRHHEKHE